MMRNLYRLIFVEPRAIFSENYKGKASKVKEGTPLYVQCHVASKLGRKALEIKSIKSRAAYVLPARVPFVIGSNWIERSSQNEGNCQCRHVVYSTFR